jgi:hypothetical protein
MTKLAPVQCASQVSFPIPVASQLYLFLHAVQNLLNRRMQRHHQVLSFQEMVLATLVELGLLVAIIVVSFSLNSDAMQQ